MNQSPFKFAVLACIVVLVGLLQSTELLAWGGVKPNVVLALLVSASFFVYHVRDYVVLTLLGALALRFSDLFVPELGVLVALLVIIFAIGARLPGKPFVNNLFLIGGATFLFYVILDYTTLRTSWGVFFVELVYNLVAGTVWFGLGRIWFLDAYEKKLRTRI